MPTSRRCCAKSRARRRRCSSTAMQACCGCRRSPLSAAAAPAKAVLRTRALCARVGTAGLYDHQRPGRRHRCRRPRCGARRRRPSPSRCSAPVPIWSIRRKHRELAARIAGARRADQRIPARHAGPRPNIFRAATGSLPASRWAPWSSKPESALGIADHRALRTRAGPRSVCDSGFDQQPARARLPSADPRWRALIETAEEIIAELATAGGDARRAICASGWQPPELHTEQRRPSGQRHAHSSAMADYPRCLRRSVTMRSASMQLAERTGLSVAALSSMLLVLELEGEVIATARRQLCAAQSA